MYHVKHAPGLKFQRKRRKETSTLTDLLDAVAVDYCGEKLSMNVFFQDSKLAVFALQLLTLVTLLPELNFLLPERNFKGGKFFAQFKNQNL